MYNKTKQKATSFARSYKPSLQEKNPQKSAPREIRTYLLYATRTAP